MTSETYSNYSWPPISNNLLPFQQYQQQQQQQQNLPLTFPLTNDCNQLISNEQQENRPQQQQQSNIVTESHVEQKFPIKLEHPFQLTAIAEGIKMDELKQRIKIEVVEEELFNKFKDVRLEMIITKAGRNLFPKLNFKVVGLEPKNCYLFSVTFKRVDNFKYKFTRSQWIENGPADDEYQQKEYSHISNARFQNGLQWMESEISFATLKLTNYQENPSKNAVVLRSLHKYCPILLIYRFDPETAKFEKFIEKEITISTFIAVTAYQNNKVTKLKVDNNPFARGFREGGRKRPQSVQSDEDGLAATSPPAKKLHQQQQFQTNPLFSTSFFANTLNYLQNWYNPNMISNEQLSNYYAQAAAFQAQNLMFNQQNMSSSNNYGFPQ